MAAIKFTDNSEETIRSFNENAEAALEAIGNQAVSHAKKVITEKSRVDTGALRNSITHKVSSMFRCYIGTNISYAIFHEYGTGIHVAGGRKSPWAYQDGKGKWHWTRGIPPIHFIKHAAEDHVDEYKAIFKKYLKNTKG